MIRPDQGSPIVSCGGETQEGEGRGANKSGALFREIVMVQRNCGARHQVEHRVSTMKSALDQNANIDSGAESSIQTWMIAFAVLLLQRLSHR